MSIYVDLRRFRREHGKMHQSVLSEILGVTQSTLSRMESMHKELDDYQYDQLVKRYGEEDVKRYVSDNPLQNSIRREAARRKQQATPPTEVANLTEVVKSQQEEIRRLNARIAELTDLLLKR